MQYKVLLSCPGFDPERYDGWDWEVLLLNLGRDSACACGLIYISFLNVLWESTRHLQVDAMDMLTSGAGFLASEVSNGVVVVGRILTQGA